MRSKVLAALAVACLGVAAAGEAATLRVVVVQTTDAAGYVKALEQGKALMKSKGSPIVLRVWRAQYAGEDAGAVVVSAEYPNLEALAKDNTRMATDPDLRSWLQGLDKFRKIVSDSIYEELLP
jgi:ABC-type sugar transport system substrate-binding protein